MIYQVILLLRRRSVTFQEEKTQANVLMFLFHENGIFTSGPERNNGQRGLYVSKVTLGKVHAGKLLSQVTCWFGSIKFSLSLLLQWPGVNACTYSAVSPSLPAK